MLGQMAVFQLLKAMVGQTAVKQVMEVVLILMLTIRTA